MRNRNTYVINSFLKPTFQLGQQQSIAEPGKNAASKYYESRSKNFGTLTGGVAAHVSIDLKEWLLKSNSFKRLRIYCVNVINLGQPRRGWDHERALTGGSCISFICLSLLSSAVISVATVTRLIHFRNIYGRQKSSHRSRPARPSEDSRRVVRGDENLAARGSGRLFRLFIGTVCTWAVGSPLRSTSFSFFGRTPNDSDTLTPMNLFLVLWPEVYVLTRLPYWRLRVEVLRTNAYACTRLQAYALRRRDYVHLSRITRLWIHAHNINGNAQSVLRFDIAQ